MRLPRPRRRGDLSRTHWVRRLVASVTQAKASWLPTARRHNHALAGHGDARRLWEIELFFLAYRIPWYRR